MTPEDEIRMQAFMLGNGNTTLPCFAILIYGAILLPDRWILLFKDFQRGRKSTAISSWTIENFSNSNTIELRESIINYCDNKREKSMILKQLSNFGAFSSMIAGALGMLFCFPFLWSSRLEDLIGAGFPFVGGAVLFGAGLITLSILSKNDEPSNPSVKKQF